MTQEIWKPAIAVSMGDPCGIGPEIVTKALARPEVLAVCRPLVIGDAGVLQRALAITGSRQALVTCATPPTEEISPDILTLFPLSSLPPEDMLFGAPTPASGVAMADYIIRGARLCLSGTVDALVTAPINKEAMHRAGIPYPGHTELLAELTGSREYVMMLAGDRLRVTLVTIHEALADVPHLVTQERVLATIRVTHRDIDRYFRKNPRLAVLALNPHCGEGGRFGDAETRIIAPAIAAARAEGIDVTGPHSADTLFHFAVQGEYDAVVCMYHDQGLIPLKLLHFDDGVNVTLGLPIIRTSVDHGTAYNLAGTGRASDASLAAAIRMAAEMAATRRRDA
jgi:4-hydroxythreonine-4-phosphate dehydrogenase